MRVGNIDPKYSSVTGVLGVDTCCTASSQPFSSDDDSTPLESVGSAGSSGSSDSTSLESVGSSDDGSISLESVGSSGSDSGGVALRRGYIA
jgi:hypothetical protein